jgi:pyridoxal phosphate enzyme (YggS family)
MSILQNYRLVKSQLSEISDKIKLIVVCKNQPFPNILPIVENGHLDFGENRVQEAQKKWKTVLKNYPTIKLHIIGKIQSNKVKDVVELFNVVHSLDSKKLAQLFSIAEKKINKKLQYFIQINIGNEPQKSGINIKECEDLISFCRSVNLNILGLMCIPPVNQNVDNYFNKLKNLNDLYNLNELSMGMSNDYKVAAKLGSTYVRVGSAIFS